MCHFSRDERNHWLKLIIKYLLYVNKQLQSKSRALLGFLILSESRLTRYGIIVS
jgi:hypothetical protein